MNVYEGNTGDFADHLQSVVKLEMLEKMTQDLDDELADSQNILKDITTLFDTLHRTQNGQEQVNGLRLEDLSRFLEAGVPNLLMPDMARNDMNNVNVDGLLATMKSFAKDLQKQYIVTPEEPQDLSKKRQDMEKLDLEQFAASLKQLSTRLANIKLTKQNVAAPRDKVLEDKLEHFAADITMFTQMIDAKTALSKSNQSWHNWSQNNALQYNNMIAKLLSGTNELSYLLQNRN